MMLANGGVKIHFPRLNDLTRPVAIAQWIMDKSQALKRLVAGLSPEKTLEH